MQHLDDAALEARFDALIRKKYPYSPDPKIKMRGKLTRAEESELFDLARESARRECARFRKEYEKTRQQTFSFFGGTKDVL